MRLRLLATALLLAIGASRASAATCKSSTMPSGPVCPFACTSDKENDCYNNTNEHRVYICRSSAWGPLRPTPTPEATATATPSATTAPSPTVPPSPPSPTAAPSPTLAPSPVGLVPGPHALLSDSHSDATSGTVARGDVIVGTGASPKWERKALGTNGQVLMSNGTDLIYATQPSPTVPPSPTAVNTSTPAPTATLQPSPTTPPSPTAASTPTLAATATVPPSPTAMSTATPAPTATAQTSPTVPPSPTAVSTATPAPTATVQPSPTDHIWATATPAPTATVQPSPTAMSTATPAPAAATATVQPSPTAVNTATPAPSPTAMSTATPIPAPTVMPSPTAQSVGIIFTSTTNATCSTSAGTTVFYGVHNTVNATEASTARWLAPAAGTIRAVYVKLGANVPAAETVTVRVSVNASTTSNPTCAIAAGASACNVTGTSKAIVAGDLIAISFNCAGGTTAVTQPIQVGVAWQ